MRRADRVTAAAPGQDSGQDSVEIAPVFGDLVFAENANATQVPVTVEGGDLIGSERRRAPVYDRMETKLAPDRAQLALIGNHFKLRRVSHHSLLGTLSYRQTRPSSLLFNSRYPMR
jgi:hypothetical protein